jgi:NAD(P)-dependent dehydrogenase (short-subunit alcohol dehydrogenase family)
MAMQQFARPSPLSCGRRRATCRANKRFVPADGVASLFDYLCSDAAAPITRANYSIDGGWTA